MMNSTESAKRPSGKRPKKRKFTGNMHTRCKAVHSVDESLNNSASGKMIQLQDVDSSFIEHDDGFDGYRVFDKTIVFTNIQNFASCKNVVVILNYQKDVLEVCLVFFRLNARTVKTCVRLEIQKCWVKEKYSRNKHLPPSRRGRALHWFEVLDYRVVEDKTTDYAPLNQALSEQFPVVRNRSELETRFYSSSQKHNQKPSDFMYDLLKIHKILRLEMTEEKLIDHIISRLEPQILDYVEVRNPQTTSNLLQIIDMYEERFLNRKIRGSSLESRDIQPNENNPFPNRNRQENWRETRGNNRYADNRRPRRKFNRFESQGAADNQIFDGRHGSGQSDHRFHNQGGRQGGSRNSAFKGQNDRNRYLNF
ncbi:uncharacterized protein TNCV_5022311 [Trichonephila clavipes]|nr:uncharacterized protein TNCV_5022311 [Trichonephila clavipes]